MVQHRPPSSTVDPGARNAICTHTLDSVSTTCIITTVQEVLVSQLTVIALHDSPVDWAHVWLNGVDSQPDSASASQHGGARDAEAGTAANGG